MGYERGSVFIYDNKFWLFEGYVNDPSREEFYRLRGLQGELKEVKRSESFFLVSPSFIPHVNLLN